jgi:hypothetical protein
VWVDEIGRSQVGAHRREVLASLVDGEHPTADHPGSPLLDGEEAP